MYTAAAFTLAAALLASTSTATPLNQRDLGAPFNLTTTARDGSIKDAPLAACHTAAGQEVLCAYPGGGQAGTPFNFNSSGQAPVVQGFTSSGALVYEEFPDANPPIYQNAALEQPNGNAAYMSFGYSGAGTYAPVAFTSANYLTYIINSTSIDSNFFLCPYSNNFGYKYNAVAHVPAGQTPEVANCTAVFVNRVF